MERTKPMLLRLPKKALEYLTNAAEQTRRLSGRNASPSATARAVIVAVAEAGVDVSGSESEVISTLSKLLDCAARIQRIDLDQIRDESKA